MINWTFYIEDAIQNGTLDEFKTIMENKIAGLVEMVKGNIKLGQRELAKCLIVLDVHNRDITYTLNDLNIDKTSEFTYQKQLRYYWESPAVEFEGQEPKPSNCYIKQTNTSILYGYEYLGNSSRLVITPLTDKCYLTLTSALSLHYGGSPAGPAGTGKTETTKDLGKAVANICIVFNCSDSINFETMARFFSGLA